MVAPEVAENDWEVFRSSLSALAVRNTKLKAKLKEVESQADLSKRNMDHQNCAKQ